MVEIIDSDGKRLLPTRTTPEQKDILLKLGVPEPAVAQKK
jgi:hypothetical protein